MRCGKGLNLTLPLISRREKHKIRPFESNDLKMTVIKENLKRQTEIDEEVIDVVRQLLIESGGHREAGLLTSAASFERDLGLGSLERVELLIRIEKHFSVSLPDTTISEAETPSDLAKIVSNAGPSGGYQTRTRSKILKSGAAQTIRPARTLTEALIRHAEMNPDRPHIYLTGEQESDKILTYQDLLQEAMAVSAGLQEKGLQGGETVAIMLPTGAHFFYAFLGILLAGGIPVPVYPPFKPNQIEVYAQRQENILRNAEAVYLVTFQRIEKLAHLLKPRLPRLRAVITTDILSALGKGRSVPPVLSSEKDPGLIQYTSGSTGTPKGVFLTHENLLANIRCMKKAMNISPMDMGVSWLPLYHDMGLIGSWLFCMTEGIPLAVLSPMTFLSRPEKWLWAIHRYGGTLSAAPNFAYEICASKIKDEMIQGLDLGSWRIALNGAEQIKPETLKRFTQRFSPHGFKPETHLPVYGMAEASVGIAFPKLAGLPKIDRVSRERFERDKEAFPAHPSEVNLLEFVSCGFPLPEHEIRIVGESGEPLGERVEGSIEFRGPSCTSGYYRNPRASETLFHGDWLVSGDLGYIADGELYITGRKKDVIIKGGRNLHPHEIERVVAEVAGVRKGCIAAFGVPDEKSGTEKLVIVAETRKKQAAEKSALLSLVNEKIVDAIGVPPDVVYLASPGSVLKTSSGKIARSACREAYLKGEMESRPARVSSQFARLFVTWLKYWSIRGVSRIGRLFYAAYLVTVLVLLGIPVWCLVWLLPAVWTGRFLRAGARVFLKLAAATPKIEGIENLSQLDEKTPVVWTANHASYLDVMFLVSCLPAGVHFVAKKELLKVPFLKTFLIKGRHVSVDREDVTKGLAETEVITALLKQGESVLIFPEGTFRPTAGLRSFKLGAFKVSVETGFPLCPVALNGTREFLRGDEWLPRRTPVTLTYCPPIYPEGDAWREVVRLREAARKSIAEHTEEIVLG